MFSDWANYIIFQINKEIDKLISDIDMLCSMAKIAEHSRSSHF